MVSVGVLATLVRAVWALFEGLRLLGDPKRAANDDADKYSARVWDVAIGIEVVGIVCGLIGFGKMQAGSNRLAYLGLVTMIIGIAIRWSAIYTLGKYFHGRVTIQPGHQLVREGLYKHVRHPAYTGSLIAHLGLGLAFANWLSLSFCVIPFVIAVWYRMHVEDEALRKAFGIAYVDYSRHTKRLIPKLY
jgi:protein-S-isoprenylcysteine O-methyltransferase Ste14